jgi:preprotein translocase subunit SecE
MNFFTKIANFLNEVKVELKKVTWPTRQETINYTLTVVLISLGVAFFLGFGDLLFSWLVNKFVI